jgi:transposase
MLTVETIRKVRIAYHRDGKSIRKTAKDLRLSRNTVRKVVRSDQTAFEYRRSKQPFPKLGAYIEELEQRLEQDQQLPKKRRRTAQALFEELQNQGYSGSYDSVQRYVKRWRRQQQHVGAQVFIPLSFDPAEAFQFDWSHESVQIDGMPVKAKAAHLRLCHSRLFLVIAYPRETQEMVFDAHMRAFEFFGGVCRKGIYDNLKAVVNKVLSGKERHFNNRFAQLCSHYLFEPIACTPAAGWEKGQVENQVGLVRRRFFTPRLKVKDFGQLNAYLMERCIGWAKTQSHPTMPEKTVWQVYQEEKPYFINPAPRFDGYAERPARVSPSSLVTYDRNRYSVDCDHVGKTVQMRVYADRIVIVRNGRLIGEHERHFGRGKTIFNPWHYLAVLERKPGALRNGAPFKDWSLPEGIDRVQQRLKGRYADWDRQFVGILQAIALYGCEPIEDACLQALKMNVISKETILNLVHRSRDRHLEVAVDLPPHLVLQQEPVADCRRYDRLLKEVHHVAQ